MEGRTKPDKLEGLSILLGAVILFAAALQSLDDPISRRGVALGVGTFGVFLLGVWQMYAGRLTALVSRIRLVPFLQTNEAGEGTEYAGKTRTERTAPDELERMATTSRSRWYRRSRTTRSR